MLRDEARVERVRRVLVEKGWDAVICTLPSNVLLLSGYWPVVGTAIAMMNRSGRVALIAPKDECDFAARGWADDLKLFTEGSLKNVDPLEELVRGPLTKMGSVLGLRTGSVVAVDGDAQSQGASYAAMNVYGAGFLRLLRQALPGAVCCYSGDALNRLRAVLTAHEVERVATACRVAGTAFREGCRKLRAGLSETEIAATFRAPLSTHAPNGPGEHRADGFAYCMSGPNAAQAAAAYQRSTSRRLAPGDFALVHCNSFVDGFWTDITRTFVIGAPSDRQIQMYEAVFAARCAALDAIRPGAHTAEVDRAARQVLEERGFGPQFPHGTGHGVGYSAIDHLARPRIHPASQEVLEPGMTFNIEPAIYIEGFGGVRHCDVVTVVDEGAHVLTPFLAAMDELVNTETAAKEGVA